MAARSNARNMQLRQQHRQQQFGVSAGSCCRSKSLHKQNLLHPLSGRNASWMLHLLLLLLCACASVPFVSASCPGVTPPIHGTMGGCTTSMATSSSCNFGCDPGYVLSSATTCASDSSLTSGTCDICTGSTPTASYLVWASYLGSLTKITPAGAQTTVSVPSVNFGEGVALSSDGSRMVVGAPNDNGQIGAVWTYQRDAGTTPQGNWVLVGSKMIGTVAGGQFGRSVALSSDGQTMAVGATQDGSMGGVYTFLWNGASWTQQAKLAATGVCGITASCTGATVGYSVALSSDGNTCAFSNPSDTSNNYLNTAFGALWVYTRALGVWTIQTPTKLTVATCCLNQNVFLGQSLALSSLGNVMAAGGHQYNNNNGAVWVWTRSGTSWTTTSPKLVYSTRSSPSAYQGFSVSLSTDGLTMAVGGTTDNGGAIGTGPGAVWMYTYVAGQWVEGQKLTGHGTTTNFARFGGSVSLSGDAQSLVVAAYTDISNKGSIFLFAQTSSGWLQQGTKIVQSSATSPTVYSVRNACSSADAADLSPADLTSSKPLCVLCVVASYVSCGICQGFDTVLSSNGQVLAFGGFLDGAAAGNPGAAWVGQVSAACNICPAGQWPAMPPALLCCSGALIISLAFPDSLFFFALPRVSGSFCKDGVATACFSGNYCKWMKRRMLHCFIFLCIPFFWLLSMCGFSIFGHALF
jgi:hypothetical protein